MTAGEAELRQVKHARIDAAIQAYESLLNELDAVLAAITGEEGKTEAKRAGNPPVSLATFLESAGPWLERLNEKFATSIEALQKALF